MAALGSGGMRPNNCRRLRHAWLLGMGFYSRVMRRIGTAFRSNCARLDARGLPAMRSSVRRTVPPQGENSSGRNNDRGSAVYLQACSAARYRVRCWL